MTADVLALPGGVAPAAVRYAPIAAQLDGSVRLHLKDLEVYSAEEPPADYSIAGEVEAVARYADSLQLERFHLIGYSGGGFIALAFAGAHPERLRSLALFEPAGIPGDPSAEEVSYRARLESALSGLSGEEFMKTFVGMQVRPGVVLDPPSRPPEPAMTNRPVGIAALMSAFTSHPFDRAVLRKCRFPVFLGYGDLTSDYEELKVAVLARLLPDLHVRRFDGVHHFVPPERIYGPKHVQELENLWKR